MGVVSKIAKGKMSKAVVFKGGKEKTKSGLTKAMLIKSKSGKIVTKKQSAAGKKAYKNIQGWTKAVQQAKKALGVTGFRLWEVRQLQARPCMPRPKQSNKEREHKLAACGPSWKVHGGILQAKGSVDI